MWLRLVLSFFLISSVAPEHTHAQTIDPHAVYEGRCSHCHAEHSGDFSRKALIAQPNGQIIGRKTGVPVGEFLARHSGNPSQKEIAALIEMFALQLKSGGLYKDKCGICHTSAKRLARVRLEIRNDRLVDRVTGRDVTEFLYTHGRLDAEEVGVIDRMLRWQLQTIGR